MLSPDHLETAGDAVAAVYADIEAQMLDRLVDTLVNGEIFKQQDMTALVHLSQTHAEDLRRIIQDNQAEVDEAVRDTVEKLLKASDRDDIKRLGEGTPIYPRQVDATIQGIARILARDNLKMEQAAQQAFLTASTEAITRVNTGTMTTERALHSAVRKLTGDGISVEEVTYQNPNTGRVTVTNRVDVAVRRHIRTQIAQDGARMALERLADLDIALVEVSSHAGCRPSHSGWQGRCYSLRGDIEIGGTRYPDFYEATGYGSVDGLMGANCRHSFGPYRHGAPRAYEPNPKHPSGLSNDEVYELTQKQRAIERQIRKAKRQVSGFQKEYNANNSPSNQVALAKAQQKLRERQAAMRDFIKDANAKAKPGTHVLTRKPNREWAGDMPKGKAVQGNGKKLGDYLDSASVTAKRKAAGVSKQTLGKAVNEELKATGIDARDFKLIPTKERNNIMKRAFERIDSKLPSTKKANAGQHTAHPFVAASSIEEALEFAAKEFGVDKLGTMYKEIGLSGANLINEAIRNIQNTLGSIKLRDIRYKPTICENVNAIAAYNPAWNGLFFSKAIKSKNASKKMKEMAQDAHESGWWSTGEEFTVINHEMGHYAHNRLDDLSKKTACDHYLELILKEQRNKATNGKTINWTKWSRGEEFDYEVIQNARANGLSGYALSNIEEMVAESFAQFYNGDVSDVAKDVLKTLLKYGKNIDRSDNALIKRRLEDL